MRNKSKSYGVEKNNLGSDGTPSTFKNLEKKISDYYFGFLIFVEIGEMSKKENKLGKEMKFYERTRQRIMRDARGKNRV